MAETAKSMISLSGQKRKDYSGFIRIRQYTVLKQLLLDSGNIHTCYLK
jgi:hypothetical protein